MLPSEVARETQLDPSWYIDLINRSPGRRQVETRPWTTRSVPGAVAFDGFRSSVVFRVPNQSSAEAFYQNYKALFVLVDLVKKLLPPGTAVIDAQEVVAVESNGVSYARMAPYIELSDQTLNTTLYNADGELAYPSTDLWVDATLSRDAKAVPFPQDRSDRLEALAYQVGLLVALAAQQNMLGNLHGLRIVPTADFRAFLLTGVDPYFPELGDDDAFNDANTEDPLVELYLTDLTGQSLFPEPPLFVAARQAGRFSGLKYTALFKRALADIGVDLLARYRRASLAYWERVKGKIAIAQAQFGGGAPPGSPPPRFVYETPGRGGDFGGGSAPDPRGGDRPFRGAPSPPPDPPSPMEFSDGGGRSTPGVSPEALQEAINEAVAQEVDARVDGIRGEINRLSERQDAAVEAMAGLVSEDDLAEIQNELNDVRGNVGGVEERVTELLQAGLADALAPVTNDVQRLKGQLEDARRQLDDVRQQPPDGLRERVEAIEDGLDKAQTRLTQIIDTRMASLRREIEGLRSAPLPSPRQDFRSGEGQLPPDLGDRIEAIENRLGAFNGFIREINDAVQTLATRTLRQAATIDGLMEQLRNANDRLDAFERRVLNIEGAVFGDNGEPRFLTFEQMVEYVNEVVRAALDDQREELYNEIAEGLEEAGDAVIFPSDGMDPWDDDAVPDAADDDPGASSSGEVMSDDGVVPPPQQAFTVYNNGNGTVEINNSQGSQQFDPPPPGQEAIENGGEQPPDDRQLVVYVTPQSVRDVDPRALVPVQSEESGMRDDSDSGSGQRRVEFDERPRLEGPQSVADDDRSAVVPFQPEGSAMSDDGESRGSGRDPRASSAFDSLPAPSQVDSAESRPLSPGGPIEIQEVSDRELVDAAQLAAEAEEPPLPAENNPDVVGGASSASVSFEEPSVPASDSSGLTSFEDADEEAERLDDLPRTAEDERRDSEAKEQYFALTALWRDKVGMFGINPFNPPEDTSTPWTAEQCDELTEVLKLNTNWPFTKRSPTARLRLAFLLFSVPGASADLQVALSEFARIFYYSFALSAFITSDWNDPNTSKTGGWGPSSAFVHTPQPKGYQAVFYRLASTFMPALVVDEYFLRAPFRRYPYVNKEGTIEVGLIEDRLENGMWGSVDFLNSTTIWKDFLEIVFGYEIGKDVETRVDAAVAFMVRGAGERDDAYFIQPLSATAEFFNIANRSSVRPSGRGGRSLMQDAMFTDNISRLRRISPDDRSWLREVLADEELFPVAGRETVWSVAQQDEARDLVAQVVVGKTRRGDEIVPETLSVLAYLAMSTGEVPLDSIRDEIYTTVVDPKVLNIEDLAVLLNTTPNNLKGRFFVAENWRTGERDLRPLLEVREAFLRPGAQLIDDAPEAGNVDL